MTQAAMGALKKVMTMQYLGVGQLLSDAGLEWEALGSLHRTSHGHLRITLPDDVLVRTQYWDAVTLLGQVMPFAQSPPGTKTIVRQLRAAHLVCTVATKLCSCSVSWFDVPGCGSCRVL